MPWYIFAAATPFFYSISVFIDKYLIEKRIKDPLALTALFALSSGVLGIVIGLIVGFKSIGLYQTGLIIFGGMLLSFYLLPYYKAMQIEDASTVIPLFQFIPVITLVLSAIFLKEILTIKQIIGLLIVVVAAISLSVDRIEGKIFKPRKTLWLMFLSSLMYGLVGILFRLTVKETNYWTTLSYQYIGTGIAGLILLLFPKVRSGIKKDIKSIKSSIGIIGMDKLTGVLAQMAEARAVSLAIVPLVNIVASIQPLLMLIEGIFLTILFPKIIKENIKKGVIFHKLVAIFFIFIGLYLVYR